MLSGGRKTFSSLSSRLIELSAIEFSRKMVPSVPDADIHFYSSLTVFSLLLMTHSEVYFISHVTYFFWESFDESDQYAAGMWSSDLKTETYINNQTLRFVQREILLDIEFKLHFHSSLVL